MLQAYGWKVIEYSNQGSESSADEKVVIINEEEFDELYGSRKESDFFGNHATVGSDGHRLFEGRLISEMYSRVKPGDIICHPFGHAHQCLMDIFKNNRHVETGIGYPTLMPDSFRIFESYAWMHYHQGKENRNGRNYEWVVPNYYDLDDWEPQYEHGEYLAFLGRVTPLKGIDTIRAIADYSPYPIVLHGQGDASTWNHPMIDFRGPISGKARSDFLRNARALLAPTVFTEPFCGMAVEAMLCGTPVISVDYGAMTETVQPGMGFRCHTLQDWLDGIDQIDSLDRKYIAQTARAKYGLESVGAMYDKVFKQIDDLNSRGWYEVDKINFYDIKTEEGPFADRLAEWIDTEYQSFDVLDVGCGPGIYVDAMRERGIEATGIDIDPRIKNKKFVSQESIFETDKKAKLVLCLEVAEHIENELSDDLVRSIVDCIKPGGSLIWSAAQPGQGGIGHINCQLPDFWMQKFLECGLTWNIEKEQAVKAFAKSGYHMGWFYNNVMIFDKLI